MTDFVDPKKKRGRHLKSGSIIVKIKHSAGSAVTAEAFRLNCCHARLGKIVTNMGLPTLTP